MALRTVVVPRFVVGTATAERDTVTDGRDVALRDTVPAAVRPVTVPESPEPDDVATLRTARPSFRAVATAVFADAVTTFTPERGFGAGSADAKSPPKANIPIATEHFQKFRTRVFKFFFSLACILSYLRKLNQYQNLFNATINCIFYPVTQPTCHRLRFLDVVCCDIRGLFG